MNAVYFRQICIAARSASSLSRASIRAVGSVPHHHSRRSNAPLIEHYRSAWPDVNPDRPAESQINLPERTVEDDKLRFNIGVSMQEGQSFFFPHLETNPADIKVTMKVSLVV